MHKLHSIAALILVFACFAYGQKGEYRSSVLDENHFQTVPDNGMPYAIIAESVLINGQETVPGDEIGIFDGDLCVGAKVIEGIFPTSVTTWEGSSQMNLPGFVSGNEIIILLWKASTGVEYLTTVNYLHGNGTFGYGAYSVVEISSAGTDVSDEDVNIPVSFQVESAYPNPFNSSLIIPFSLPQPGDVQISVFNTLGQLVLQENRYYPPGEHRYHYSPEKNLASNNRPEFMMSGVYFVRFDYLDQTRITRAIYIK